LTNSLIIPPCYIGENVVLTNAIVGPHVSIGANSKLGDVVIKNSIVQSNVSIQNAVLENSMIGMHAKYTGTKQDISISDYSTFS
jgi:glucose-1-phosphate thymidylyltransferase